MTHRSRERTNLAANQDHERSVSRVATSVISALLLGLVVVAVVYIARNGVPFH